MAQDKTPSVETDEIEEDSLKEKMDVELNEDDLDQVSGGANNLKQIGTAP